MVPLPKVKCDRKFPCAGCIKSGIQCIPSTLVHRQRKKRFPERILLDRLRGYEALLRQNGIRFEPLHKDVAGAGNQRGLPGAAGDDHDDEIKIEAPDSTSMPVDEPSPATTSNPDRSHQTK